MSDANLHNPLTKYDHDEFPKQYQEPPGLQKEMKPVPDCGETSYKGAGKLKGRKALVTGGDSGIGRAAAIAYAREGADVAINYLPEEQPDAEEVKALIEKEGRKAVLLPGDLSDEAFCGELAEKRIKSLAVLTRSLLSPANSRQWMISAILLQNKSIKHLKSTYSRCIGSSKPRFRICRKARLLSRQRP